MESQQPMRLRLTVVVEYDANPEHYGTTDPELAAGIDRANWEQDPMMLYSSFDDEQFQITVEPVMDAPGRTEQP